MICEHRQQEVELDVNQGDGPNQVEKEEEQKNFRHYVY